MIFKRWFFIFLLVQSLCVSASEIYRVTLNWEHNSQLMMLQTDTSTIAQENLLVMFWNESCVDCIHKMSQDLEELKALQASHKFSVITVNSKDGLGRYRLFKKNIIRGRIQNSQNIKQFFDMAIHYYDVNGSSSSFTKQFKEGWNFINSSKQVRSGELQSFFKAAN